ncbi:hypothetical protein B0H21DRAFT_714234, partial [Amylocystis lapponica]
MEGTSHLDSSDSEPIEPGPGQETIERLLRKTEIEMDWQKEQAEHTVQDMTKHAEAGIREMEAALHAEQLVSAYAHDELADVRSNLADVNGGLAAAEKCVATLESRNNALYKHVQRLPGQKLKAIKKALGKVKTEHTLQIKERGVITQPARISGAWGSCLTQSSEQIPSRRAIQRLRVADRNSVGYGWADGRDTPLATGGPT